jgi:hypothetical protein
MEAKGMRKFYDPLPMPILYIPSWHFQYAGAHALDSLVERLVPLWQLYTYHSMPAPSPPEQQIPTVTLLLPYCADASDKSGRKGTMSNIYEVNQLV